MQNMKFVYPAEWEKQSATWLSWPHNEKEWRKNKLKKLRVFYEDLILKILDFQDVKLVFATEKLLNEAEKKYKFFYLVKKKKFKLYKIIIPNNDIWIRDYGPIFLKQRAKKIIVDFKFNAWGGKYPPWNLDNEFPKNTARFLGLNIESYPICLEGGALEFSGSGIVLTTERCILNKNRNPKITKKTIDTILKTALRVKDIIWLKDGLKYDHTDGHIDNIARFIGKEKLIVASVQDKKNNNYKVLKENHEALKKYKIKNKKSFEIIELPIPVSFIKRTKLPASYINFIFVNNGILFPIFNCKEDKVAYKILKKTFPRKKIIGIDCRLLISEGGTLHCMSKQEGV